ncbi:MAG: hypothetical protein LBG87_00445 [Spirochaetaceae bacterium]|jgi:YD repeat-containing protein|nr:hypothetical protein [Spirochaetaceae bacterium]
MRRFFLFIIVFFVSLAYGWGQPRQETSPSDQAEAPQAESEGAFFPFPLGPILVAIQQKAVIWQPDWDAAMPPDGFRVAAGQASSIALTLKDQTYRVRWNPDGSPAEFPFWLADRFVQVRADYHNAGSLKKLEITGSDEPGLVDFISDTLARITQGDTVYFTAVRFGPPAVAETWYDPEGTALADFISQCSYAGPEPQLLAVINQYAEQEKRYYYDSFGNITEIRGPDGTCSALYAGEQMPRYWTRYNETHVLQWDERKVPVRISAAERASVTYEYTVDARGNWTERREIRLSPQSGTLVPSQGLTVTRTITYQ